MIFGDPFLMISLSQCLLTRLARRPLIVGALALLTAARSACATPFVIDLGNSRQITSQVSASFGGLDGTTVLGQSLSLDLTWANGKFGRLFTITSPSFEAAITLRTNGSGILGFLQGTGFLMDANGNAIPGWGITGSASGDDGSLSLGLFPLFKDEQGTPNDDLLRPLDFFGIHYDLTFPVADSSVFVTGGQFDLVSYPGQVFGVGPGVPRDIVPDFGATFLLLGIGVALIQGIRIRLISVSRQ